MKRTAEQHSSTTNLGVVAVEGLKPRSSVEPVEHFYDVSAWVAKLGGVIVLAVDFDPLRLRNLLATSRCDFFLATFSLFGIRNYKKRVRGDRWRFSASSAGLCFVARDEPTILCSFFGDAD